MARGEVWGDPDTNERAEIKDWEERTWRHLDICQFEPRRQIASRQAAPQG